MNLNIPSKYKLSICLVGNKEYFHEVENKLSSSDKDELRLFKFDNFHSFEHHVFTKKCDVLIIDDLFFQVLGDNIQQFQMLYDINLFSIIMVVDENTPLECVINPHIFYRNFEVGKGRFLHNIHLYLLQADYFTRIARENDKFKLDAQNRIVAEKIKKKKAEHQELKRKIDFSDELSIHLADLNFKKRNPKFVKFYEKLEIINDIDSLKTLIYDELKSTLRIDRYSIFLVDRDFKDLILFMSSDDKITAIRDISLIDLFDKSIMFEALYKKESVYIDNFTNSKFNAMADQQSNYNADDCMCVPLLFRQKAIGVLNINDSQEEKITEIQTYYAELIASFLAVKIENFRR